MSDFNALFIIGASLLIGAYSTYIFKKLKQPQVIGHILVGILLGVSGIKLFSDANIVDYKIITDFALGLIGFSIGGELRWARLKRFGANILAITFFEASMSTLFVTSVIYLITKNLPLALIIGALAAATAPGGTTTVIQEYRARGPLTSTLFGVVGADDAFAILIYAIMTNFAKSILVTGNSMNLFNIVHTVSLDIFGSILFGCLFGLIMSRLMRRIKDPDMKQLIILGFIFLCCGIALLMHLSLILASMSMGIIVANIRPHSSKSYFVLAHKFSPPIFILFFVLVGARLNISLLPSMGIIGILYIIFRILGKYMGAWLGAKLSRSPKQVRNYLGFCLFSQAGVALGLAISAELELSLMGPVGEEIGFIILNVITATTFVFQVIGPIFAKYALSKAKEIRI